MGILVWSARVRDLLGKSSFWVTGKRRVPGIGFMGLGISVPNSYYETDDKAELMEKNFGNEGEDDNTFRG
jgi:hypothetical protein